MHAGSFEYASDFARGALVLVEIDPADVVSVPTSDACQKLRTCKYKVLRDCSGQIQRDYIPSDIDDDDFFGAPEGLHAEDSFDDDADDDVEGEPIPDVVTWRDSDGKLHVKVVNEDDYVIHN